MRPPWATPNEGKDTAARCGHCENMGLVVLDGAGPEYGAPCPMCRRGELFDRYNYGGRYWQTHDLVGARWQHGLSVRHVQRCRVEDDRRQVCGRPSLGKFCDQCSAAMAAKRGAA